MLDDGNAGAKQRCVHGSAGIGSVVDVVGVDADQQGARTLQVLGRIRDLTLAPMDREVDCCGFGGSFSVRFPEVSTSMADDKLASAERTGAEALVVTDVGCMMQLEGRARQAQKPLRVVHLAELLADSNVRRP